MASNNLRLAGNSKRANWVRTGIWFFAFAAGSLVLLQMAPRNMLPLDDLTLPISVALFAVVLLIALARARALSLDSRKTFVALGLVAWWYLMVSEMTFAHDTGTVAAATGGFPVAAFQEAVSWGIVFAVVVFISALRPQRFSSLFSGPYKWMTLFVLLALASVPLSPSPTYSLAWGFKLAVVVWLLVAFANSMEQLGDLVCLLYSLMAGFFVITLLRAARPFFEPGPVFMNGRLNGYASPTGLSALAGILLLLAMTLYALRRRAWLIGVCIYAVCVMIVSGGKAGIAGGIISAVFFFLLQRKLRYAWGMLLALFVIGGVLLVTTPLAKSLQQYNQSGQAATLTGRTDLWTVVWPAILEKPIFGHGYVASRFLALDVNVIWDPGHTHNSFLESLYNNGIFGFLLILVMNFFIIRNLSHVIKRRSDRESYYLAVGAFAIYLNIFINGMFKVTFGGSPDSSFMMFLALVMISIKLAQDPEPAPLVES
jgi:O-antigen ligase